MAAQGKPVDLALERPRLQCKQKLKQEREVPDGQENGFNGHGGGAGALLWKRLGTDRSATLVRIMLKPATRNARKPTTRNA